MNPIVYTDPPQASCQTLGEQSLLLVLDSVTLSWRSITVAELRHLLLEGPFEEKPL